MENINNNSYIVITKTAKKIARDILRMEKLNKWLTKKAKQEAVIKEENESFEKQMKEMEKEAQILEYDAEHMPEDHPAKEDTVKEAEEYREETDKRKENLQKSHDNYIESLEKTLEDINTAIEEWTEGKRKVSYERLNQITDELVKEYGVENFKKQKADAPKAEKTIEA